MPLQTMMTMMMMMIPGLAIVVQHDQGLHLKFQEWSRASHSVLNDAHSNQYKFWWSKSKASAQEGEMHVSLLDVTNSDSCHLSSLVHSNVKQYCAVNRFIRQSPGGEDDDDELRDVY
jgi:hypothetical protein